VVAAPALSTVRREKRESAVRDVMTDPRKREG